MRQQPIKAFVFDAYGTLLDVHSAVGKAMDDLGKDAEDISNIWRTKQLEYTWLRSLMGKHADFWQVTSDALRYALRCHNMENDQRHDKLMALYLELSAYRDAFDTVKYLKTLGHTTLILSNGSQYMLDKALENSGLDEYIDRAISIDEVGIYKPSPVVYKLATDHMKCSPAEILFVSANAWDVAGANTFGFRVAWINRFKRPPEILPGGPEFIIDSLSELEQLINK